MWQLYTFVIISFLGIFATQKITDMHKVLKGCHPGDIAENEHNKCICTPSFIFECFTKPYNTTEGPVTNEKPTCYPEMIYALDSVTCICKEDGYWPHSQCEEVFKSFPNSTDKKCEPDSYIIDGCNVCKCGLNGYVDKTHCTKNECNKTDVSRSRRYLKGNHVYGSCTAKSWYSLAPCQFCYCISENKLVCNTGSVNTKNLHLGSYNLSVCGEDLISEAMSLVPDTQKQSVLREGKKTNKYMPSRKEVTTTDKIFSYAPVDQPYKKLKSSEESRKESAEYYSDVNGNDEEERPSIYQNGVGKKTTIPFQEIDDTTDKNQEKLESDDTEDDGVEIFVSRKPVEEFKEAGQKTKPGGYVAKALREGAKKLKLKDAIQSYVPFDLDRVFKLASRKSFVNVHNETCTPDTQSYKDCNRCFCFERFTLVCTNFICESKSPIDDE